MLYTVGDQFNVFYFSFEVEPYVIQGSGGLVAQLQSWPGGIRAIGNDIGIRLIDGEVCFGIPNQERPIR